MLINYGLLPSELEHQKRVYMWVKYIRKAKSGVFYKLDDRALAFYEKVLDSSKLQYDNSDGYITMVDQKYVDKYYESEMAKVKAYIAANHDELLSALNHKLFLEQWEKYGMDNVEQGEMQSMRMYVKDHELADISLPYVISDLSKIEEEEADGNFFIEGKIIPRYVIHHIVGTVVDKNKLKSKITVLTPDGPAEVKIWKNQFAFYDQTLIDQNGEEKTVRQASFFEIGTHLMLTGMKRGNQFVLKKYKNTKVDDTILKIHLKKDEYSELEAKIKTED